jgi:uncharacterized damage-inducible protein DinB
MLTFKDVLLKELHHESIGTRKMLALVPLDVSTWKPHAKSMPMRELAIHIADIPTWISLAIHTDELDFASSPYNPKLCTTTEELLAYFDDNINKAANDLEGMSEGILEDLWTLRNGAAIFMQSTKIETIRMSYCQMVHHRAQLGVYLRLLDIPIPGVYGPSADEMGL